MKRAIGLAITLTWTVLLPGVTVQAQFNKEINNGTIRITGQRTWGVRGDKRRGCG